LNGIEKKSGQTLIEVLVTVLIIAVGVIALIRFQGYLAYQSSLTQQYADAEILAISKIESLRDFEVRTTTSGYNAYSDITSGSQNSTVGNTTYTISWVVTDNTSPDYKVLNVTVSWTDIRSASQSVNIITRIAGLEPYHSASVM